MPVGKFDYSLETWVLHRLVSDMFLIHPELELMSYGNIASSHSSQNTFMLFATTVHLWYTPQSLSLKTFKKMELFTSSCVPLQGVSHQRISARMITSEQSSTVSQASILHRRWKRIWYSRLTAGTTRPQLLKSWTSHSSTEIKVLLELTSVETQRKGMWQSSKRLSQKHGRMKWRLRSILQKLLNQPVCAASPAVWHSRANSLSNISSEPS